MKQECQLAFHSMAQFLLNIHDATETEWQQNFKMLSNYINAAYWMMKYEVPHTHNTLREFD